MKDVLLFANPIAGGGRAGGVADSLRHRLAPSGWNVRVITQPIDSLPDDQLAIPAAAAIVIGGDGTLRAVVQRLLAARGNVPPVLVMPMGTANLMARHLKIAWDMQTPQDQIAAALKQMRTVELDAATANGQLFLLMAGIGIDAAVVHELDRIRSGPINFASYALPALEAMRSYDYPSLRVTIDGRCVLNNEPAMAFVGNVAEYGTGFPILTKAKSNDQLLDICVLPCTSRQRVLRLLMAAASGDHLHEEGVIYAQGRSIQIDSSRQVPVQLDGDAAGHTPVRIELLQSSVPFIVPQT